MEDALLYVLVQEMALIQQLMSQSGLWALLPSPSTNWWADEILPALAWTNYVGNMTRHSSLAKIVL